MQEANCSEFTHMPLAALSQTTYSNAFSWKFCISIQISFKFVPNGPINNKSRITLAPNRQQTIIWTNDDPVHRRIYGVGNDEGDELSRCFLVTLYGVRDLGQHSLGNGLHTPSHYTNQYWLIINIDWSSMVKLPSIECNRRVAFNWRQFYHKSP